VAQLSGDEGAVDPQSSQQPVGDAGGGVERGLLRAEEVAVGVAQQDLDGGGVQLNKTVPSPTVTNEVVALLKSDPST